jgi:adenylate cyclase
MARNVEIKARVSDMDAMRDQVAAIADHGPETLTQTDTFFQVSVGRLKLREFSDSSAELIYYNRPDSAGPTESQYERAPVVNARPMRELLSETLGTAGTVRKKRQVYWIGRTRVHLDEVEDLGNFLELEVVLKEHEPRTAGIKEAEQLMERLGIDAGALVPDAYVDLLRQGRNPTQS